MAADDLKGEDLLQEAARIFDTPSATPPGGAPQKPEAPSPPPAPPAPTSVKPEDIKSEEDLFREANRILGR